MSNESGLNEGDAARIHALMELAAQNQWYALAQKLRDAREMLRKHLDDEWARRTLEHLSPGERE